MSEQEQSAIFCADIGGSFVKFGVFKGSGEIIFLTKRPIPSDSWEAFVHLLAALLDEYAKDYPEGCPLAISTAGIINKHYDHVFAGNIPAFGDHQFCQELSAFLHRPVVVANDADCFTLAEATMGQAKGHSIVFGAILGTGVGGSLVIDQRIIQGTTGMTGEWGHSPITQTQLKVRDQVIDLPRLPCSCGQVGCLDTYGGARGIERLYQMITGQIKSSRDIVSDWHRRESGATETIDCWLAIVREPMAFVINLLGASIVVVGGGLASDHQLVGALDRQVRPLLLANTSKSIVVPGEYHQNGGLLGAAIYASQQ
ncbi:MAG: N-acetyl-D-glucosamine kinase [Candidatus Celerinatantimonas neptuna]|nr:MAG: N-acetyl-D-glucosamine kinase [Candidatus Celerinatantimonas neptuna]